MSGIYSRINECYDQLSETEQEVIDFILKYEDIDRLKLKEINDALFVSNATVIRACKKLNYATFNELKIDLIRQKREQLDTELAATDFSKVLHGIKKDTLTTLELVSEEQINEVCNLLITARRIFCIGTGSSSEVASEFNRKLKLIDLWSNDYFDQFSIERVAQIASSEDVIVVFSLSGEVNEVNEVMIKAKSNGAKIIAVTNMSMNPLKQISDYSLLVYSSPSNRKKIRSRLMLYLMSTLIYEKLVAKIPDLE